jgi:hypothetical protein
VALIRQNATAQEAWSNEARGGLTPRPDFFQAMKLKQARALDP